jgi:lysozyme
MNLDIATALCKQFEGFGKGGLPYLCPAGIPTIGYGSTYYANGKKVQLIDIPISEQDAADLLLHELQYTYLPGVLRLCPILLTDMKKCNAITDFAYNLGVGRLQTSTLRRKINEQDWDAAKEQLMLWNKGGGRVLPGLNKRRKAECQLFD